MSNAGDEHLDVVRADSLLQTEQGLAHVHAETLLVIEPCELRAEGPRHLAADELHCGLQRVASTQRVDEHVERFGQLLLKLLHALRGLVPEQHHGHRPTNRQPEEDTNESGKDASHRQRS
jgi:hypothetical protein